MQMTWRWYSEGNDQIKLSYIIAPGFLVSNQNRKPLFNDDGTPRPAPHLGGQWAG